MIQTAREDVGARSPPSKRGGGEQEPRFCPVFAFADLQHFWHASHLGAARLRAIRTGEHVARRPTRTEGYEN